LALIPQLERFEGFILDLDGVVYLRKAVVPGAPRFVEELGSSGKKLVFLTNNSSRTREDYVTILSGFGIKATKEEVVTSAYATCLYLLRRRPVARVFVVGEAGLRDELSCAGFRVVRQPPAHFVVVGIDLHFTYDKLRLAVQMIRQGAKFVSTNRDATYPTEEGPHPGAGSIVAAIRTASGRRPTDIGKPNRRIFDMCRTVLGTPAGNTAVIGDRIETDILGGLRAGMGTILVLSGVTTRGQMGPGGVRPDLVVDSVADLFT